MNKYTIKWRINYDNMNLVEVIEMIGNSLDIEEIYNFGITYNGDLITLDLGQIETVSALEAAHRFKYLLLEDTEATFFSVFDENDELIGDFDVVNDMVNNIKE